MSLTTHPINTISSQKVNKPSRLTRLFAPLVLGTAVALGSASPAMAEQNLPEQPVPEQPAPAQEKNCSPHKFFFGYVAGAIMGHLLEKLHQKNKS